MIVAQLFNTYLKTTENWIYNLIRNLAGVDLLIVAEYSENTGQFPLPNARFLFPFYSTWRSDRARLIQKVVNRICSMLGHVWRKTILFHIRKPDIMHAHFSVVGWDYLLLAKTTKIPLAISFYGFDYEYLPTVKPVWKARYQKLFKEAALFITEGTEGRNKLISMGCPASKVKIVHLGVELDAIPFYERRKNKFELNLVQVARFTDKKGQDVTAAAFMQAVKTCPNLTLTFVGTDPHGIRARLQSQIADKGLSHAVRFLDSIEYAQLYFFLKDYHVFIHPSRYGKHRDSEGGAPIVLLDAQATGMPVLSTLHCDIPDEVINGKTGILVRENEVQELADAIEYFYSMDEQEYHAYGKRARTHVEAHYRASQCAQELLEAYQSVLR